MNLTSVCHRVSLQKSHAIENIYRFQQFEFIGFKPNPLAATRTSRCLPQIVQNIRGVPIVFEMRVRIPSDEFYDENVLEYWTGR